MHSVWMSRKSAAAAAAGVVAADAMAVAAVVADLAAVAAVVVEVADIAVAEPAVDTSLQPIATAIGEAWANELVESLRSARREVVGGWPGTLGEARMRIRTAMRGKLALDTIDSLARVAYVAARRGWQAVSRPDPEP